LGDVCFVMMTPSSQEMGPPRIPVRFSRSNAISLPDTSPCG
jgi:hypothetical protein